MEHFKCREKNKTQVTLRYASLKIQLLIICYIELLNCCSLSERDAELSDCVVTVRAGTVVGCRTSQLICSHRSRHCRRTVPRWAASSSSSSSSYSSTPSSTSSSSPPPTPPPPHPHPATFPSYLFSPLRHPYLHPPADLKTYFTFLFVGGFILNYVVYCEDYCFQLLNIIWWFEDACATRVHACWSHDVFPAQLSTRKELSEARATAARNEYLLNLAASNAHQRRYYSTDLPKLIEVRTQTYNTHQRALL